METKYKALLDNLKALGRVAVAFSGGVDSTFLLMAAREALSENAVAFTADSCFMADRERKDAHTFCAQHDIPQLILEVKPLAVEEVRKNPANRCYLCKKEIFQTFLDAAKENSIPFVVEGSNMDDLGDYRPGLQAIAELGIRSPLREAGLTKEEIRLLSKKMNLPTWDKPSFACLASRIPYGDEINEDKLAMVDRAEQVLFDLGFDQLRVRVHGKIARIEIEPEHFLQLLEVKDQVNEKLRALGFSYVTMDLAGFRSGSLNEALV